MPLSDSEILDLMEKFARMVPIPLSLEPVMLMAVVSHVQLALRHPHAQGPASDQARHFVRQVRDYLERALPGMGELIERGDKPEHDVPWPGFPMPFESERG